MAGKFKVGDLVRHKQTRELVFVVEFELVNAEGGDSPSLYQCSHQCSSGMSDTGIMNTT